MKHDQRTVFKIMRLILLTLVSLSLVSTTEGSAQAQESTPTTKENLLRAIKRAQEEKRTVEWHVELVRQLGVDFRMTDADEREIRQAGSHLGAKGLNDLVAAVRANYRKPERLRVSLFKYARCNEKFEDFVAVIHSKITLLPGKFASKGVRYRYVTRLNLVKETKPFNSWEEADRYWNDTRSLQLLQGMCSSRGNDLYVLSQVFLGDLHGSLVTPVRIEFKIDEQEFSDTKDIHSLLILYSLAQEAHARGLSKELIFTYLSEAREIADQIKNQKPETLQTIRGAIERMFHELGASNLMVLPSQ